MMNAHVLNFWKKVRRGDSAECWPWTGYAKKSGHGLTWLLGHPIHASRKAWIISRGEIPEGLCVNHKCGNALCCNPSHMYLGTRAENMGDRFGTDGKTLVQRRRERAGRGRPSKLSDSDKHELRRYREAGVSIERCARMYQISTGTVMKVLAELRLRLGREKLPDERYARSQLFTSRKSAGSTKEHQN